MNRPRGSVLCRSRLRFWTHHLSPGVKMTSGWHTWFVGESWMRCCRHEWTRRSLERRPFLLSAFTNQKDRTTHCVTTHSVDCSRHSRCVPSPLQLYEPSSFCVPPQCRWPCLTLASQTTKARLASCTGPSCRTWYGPSSSRSGRASLASASSFAGTSGTRRCGEDKYDAWKSVSAVDMRVATSGTTERSRCDKRTGLPESASVFFTVFLLLGCCTK